MRIVLTTLLLLAAMPAWATPTVTTIEVPGAGSTDVGAISPSGIVAGSYRPGGSDACGAMCGFLRMPDATFTTFSVFGASAVQVYAATDAGAVVGGFIPAAGIYTEGFIRMPGGTLKEIKYRKSFTTVMDMNASGIAVGQVSNGQGYTAFLWTPDGKIKFFTPRGCTNTLPTSINAAGTVTGFCLRHSKAVGFLRALDGTAKFFKMRGQKSIGAADIDDTGAITGTYIDKKTQTPHGYIRDADGTFHIFDLPGQFDTGTRITAMATVGGDRQVVGYLEDDHQRNFGFIHHADGTDETFDVSGGHEARGGTFVSDISASGVVAGDYMTDDLAFHGYIRTP